MFMRGSLKYLAAAALAVGVMAAATLLAWAEDWNAEWQLRPAFSVDMLHFTVRHSTALGHWSTSRDVSLDNFRGLSLAMLAAGGPAKFEYVGDAGRLMCEGRFAFSSGSGSFTFAPNADFVQELVRLGYDAPDDDQLFSMLIQNVDRRFARDVRDTGLHASAGQLVQLKNHGIGFDYIREVRAAGYTDMEVPDLVQLKNHGVSSSFLRDLKADGYNLRTSDIVQLRNHGVTSEYMRGLKDAGYASVSVSEITQLRNHGVQPGLIEEAKRLGYDFTPQELTQLQMHGVTADYLRKIKDSGMRNLTAAQITRLRMHGVE
jgi:hypothetical protein